MAVAVIVLACVLSGAVLGSLLRLVLPREHLTDESRDAIKVGIGLIATLVALVLGLLVASAKGSFDVKAEEIQDAAVKVILIDQQLKRLGPGGGPIRAALRRAVEFRIQQPWGEDVIRSLGDGASQAPTIGEVETQLQHLSPANDEQRQVQTRALALCGELSTTRWLLVEQAGSAISTPFLVVVVTWLTVIFTSLGLLAPSNATVRVVILLCGISVSASVLLILELDRPFQGLITLSKEPLRTALMHLGPAP